MEKEVDYSHGLNSQDHLLHRVETLGDSQNIALGMPYPCSYLRDSGAGDFRGMQRLRISDLLILGLRRWSTALRRFKQEEQA